MYSLLVGRLERRKKMLVVRDREAGNIITEVTTVAEGERLVAEYEAEDKRNEIYEENFYEIMEVDD